MKLTNIFLIFLLLITALPAQEIIDLGVPADFYDLEADAKNVIHIFWMKAGVPYYGQLKNNEIINQETIPGMGYVATNKFRPRLSVMPDGHQVHIGYSDKETNGNTVKHAYKDNTGWHVKTAYVATSGRMIQYPAAAVDGQGVAHIVCARFSANSPQVPVIYVRKPQGGNYHEMEYLSPKELSNIWPDVYSDKNGNVHAVWSINKFTLHYRFAEAGGDLSKSKTIDIPKLTYWNKQPDVYVDFNNNIHLAYLSYDRPPTQINQGYSWASLDDFFFSTTEHANPELIKMEGHYHDDPVIGAVDPDNVYISWAKESAANKVNIVELAKKTDGVWKMIRLDDEATLKTTSGPKLGMSRNKIHIVWRSANKTLKMYTETIGYGEGISSPEDGDNVCGPLVDIEANMDPELVSKVEFFVDGASIGSSDVEPFMVQWDASDATLGQHAFSIKASMIDGSTKEHAITVTLNCPPEISIINLVDGGCVSGTFDIELHADDDRDELTKVELYIDNTLVQTYTAPPYSYTWNTDGLSPGSHTVKAMAYEASGQTNTDTVSVKTCPVYQPLNLTGEFSLKQTIFFLESSSVLSWQENTANSSIAEYRIYRIKKGIRELAAVNDPQTLTFKEVVDNEIEELIYTVTTVDNAGSESTGAFVVLKKIQ